MTDPTSKHAWPLKQYDGSREGYEEYEVDKDAWLIDKGYDKQSLDTQEQHGRPRCLTKYKAKALFDKVKGGHSKTSVYVSVTNDKCRLQGVGKNTTR